MTAIWWQWCTTCSGEAASRGRAGGRAGRPAPGQGGQLEPQGRRAQRNLPPPHTCLKDAGAAAANAARPGPACVLPRALAHPHAPHRRTFTMVRISAAASRSV